MIDKTINYKLLKFTKDEIREINEHCIREFDIIEQTDSTTKRIDTQHDLFWTKIYPEVSEFLTEEFEVKNGFWHNTSQPYPIHSDGRRNNESMYRTVLIPLDIDFYDASIYEPHKNQLILFEQTSDYATVFKAGSEPKNSSYRFAKDYDDYRAMANGFTNTYFHHPFVKEICPHLTTSELFGLSYSGMVNWSVGSVIVFHPHIIHTSSDFTRLGVTSKTNLVYSLLLK